MPTNLFHALSTAAIFSAPTSGAVGTLLPAALLVCAVILVVGGMRLRSLQAQHTTQTQQLQQQNDTVRTMQQQLHQVRADLDDRQQETRTLRQESGAQRKKNHALQDDLKRLRASLKEETERRIAAQNTRPAFADPAPRKNAVQEAAAPARAAKPTDEAQTRPASPVEPVPPPAGPSPHELAMQAQIKTLASEVARHQQTLHEERTAAAQVKDELKRLRKRSEDLRRIDIITKSKMEILEDKLRHLGRAHYEAISEVALLKGEVQPPRPREAPRAPSPFEAPQELHAPQEHPASEDTDGADEDFDTSPAPHDAPSVAQSASLL